MRITRANQAVIDVCGKGDDVTGKNYSQLLPELRNTGIYQKLKEVYSTGVPYNIRNSRVNLFLFRLALQIDTIK